MRAFARSAAASRTTCSRRAARRESRDASRRRARTARIALFTRERTMAAQRRTVGFVGLGAMGAHMARHVHARGMLHAVLNRSAEKARSLARELGVDAVEDASELARDCDVIVTCVTADADVIALCDAFARARRPGLVVVDTSTIAATSAMRAAAILRSAGGDLVDAPVSGGVEGARTGTLSVMAGGEAETLARATPVLECFAARITHMGSVGAGQNTKAVNQVLVAGIAQAVCEGLALGEALGLPADKLIPTLQAGAAACWFLDKRGATMLAGDYTPGFKLGLLVKDLHIVREMAVSAGVDHSVVDLSLEQYGRMMSEGRGDEDTSALIRVKRGSTDR
ncbi:MAG TPA: NAD(P)-dependent oxidoreductase [Candidatus Saccharimonadia bacterium]|nr:NAD(P)-dependent oxidoreductase [Candidatus Saccharimonadia bacterium]